MTNSLGILGLMAEVVGAFFTFWPVVVLTPLGWRRGNVYGGIVTMWVVMLFGWIAARSASIKPMVLLIPEPLNTVLFFLTGMVLIAWPVIQKLHEHQYLFQIGYRARKPQELLDMSPTEFEKMVFELYSLHGYRAERTGTIGDHGVDIVVHTPKGDA
jgi:Restriction endonuclease